MSCCGGSSRGSNGVIKLIDKTLNMEYIRANFKKRFTLRDKEGKLYTQEFLKGDEYLKDEFTEESYKILTNYKNFGISSFTVFNNSEEPNKKQVEEKVSDIYSQYEEKFGKEVPRNKKNDEEWIKSKLQEETPSE